jgi:hypothetical protein
VLLDINFGDQIIDGVYPRFKFLELTHERKMEILDRVDKAYTRRASRKRRSMKNSTARWPGLPELPKDVESAGTKQERIALYEEQQRRYREVFLLKKAI